MFGVLVLRFRLTDRSNDDDFPLLSYLLYILHSD